MANDGFKNYVQQEHMTNLAGSGARRIFTNFDGAMEVEVVNHGTTSIVLGYHENYVDNQMLDITIEPGGRHVVHAVQAEVMVEGNRLGTFWYGVRPIDSATGCLVSSYRRSCPNCGSPMIELTGVGWQCGRCGHTILD